MITRMNLLVLAGVLILGLSVDAHAKRGGVRGKETIQVSSIRSDNHQPWIDVEISREERQIIRHYFIEHERVGPGKPYKVKKKSLPPGLAKKVARGGTLPPGWQRKVARGEVMTEEIYVHAEPLPREILIKLPPPPKDTVLVKVEGRVVRLLQATRTILDVFDL
jgi:hypothetical protein